MNRAFDVQIRGIIFYQSGKYHDVPNYRLIYGPTLMAGIHFGELFDAF